MSSRRSDRRDFLAGLNVRGAMKGIGRTMAEELAPPPATRTQGEGLYLEVARRAMACEFTLLLRMEHLLDPVKRDKAADRALEAFDRIDHLENLLSVYRLHSDVSRINRTAARQPARVEGETAEVLARGLALAEQTDGAFDFTAGPLIRAWGFFDRRGRVPEPDALEEARSKVGFRHVRYDREAGTIAYDVEGLEINLGAIGKGYALDQAAVVLQRQGSNDFLFQGGSSSVVARGSESAKRPGWTIGIIHPLRPDTRLGVLTLVDQALGTSGAAFQSFYHQGERYGHILDPRSGIPAKGIYGTTVTAPDGASADAVATALYVMGVEGAAAFCAAHPEIGAILTVPGRRAGEVTVHAFNLPPERWKIEAATASE
ncbi:MAG TPA: FAD:protein FMN transferase [Pirellulaceae bacterium]|jgi:thiamine biosynthesis lipoprotein|nr:FAD:protein FMN transferase [Pirellulaceae bacterium]